jgi:hypothetical protein
MGLFSFGSNAVRFSLQVLALFGLLRNIIYLEGSHLFPAILAVSQKYIIFLGMFFLLISSYFLFIFYLALPLLWLLYLLVSCLSISKEENKGKPQKRINASLYKNVKLTCMCIY